MRTQATSVRGTLWETWAEGQGEALARVLVTELSGAADIVFAEAVGARGVWEEGWVGTGGETTSGGAELVRFTYCVW